VLEAPIVTGTKEIANPIATDGSVCSGTITLVTSVAENTDFMNVKASPNGDRTVIAIASCRMVGLTVRAHLPGALLYDFDRCAMIAASPLPLARLAVPRLRD
jgi:hypothetical protein